MSILVLIGGILDIYRQLFALTIVSLTLAICQACYADSFTSNASTNIRTAIIITENTAMTFGTIFADPAGDTVRMRPNNNLTFTNGSTSLGGQTSGRFRVEGEANASISYTVSSGDVLTGPGVDIPITALQVNRSSPFSLNGRGRRNFRVGATITIAPSQVGGTYTGTYTLTMNYE